MGRRTALLALGATLVTAGVAFLVPFVEQAINGEDVALWPNPLFLAPLAVLVIGLGILLALVLTRDGEDDHPPVDESTTFKTMDRSKVIAKNFSSTAKILTDSSGESQVEMERFDHSPSTLKSDAEEEEEIAAKPDDGDGDEPPEPVPGGTR